MERPKANDAPIPRKVDRYEIHERIGSGGMGLIFKGFDTRLKRNVAIKMISDRVRDESVRKNIRERFFNEARAAGAISHPNIVQIYDVGEVEQIVYIVMEYIEGETLEQLLKSKGPLNKENLLKVSKEIASGLSFAHKRGIVHRDVKPSNIIIEANTGVSKILDFGIAKFVDEEEMKLTSTGMVLGSTHYLSPEHITGKNLDGRSDIFCLGTLLYESATGVLPFRGNNSSTILYKIVHFDPPPAHEVRTDLDTQISKVISKCLQKKPEDRYQTGDEIVQTVQDLERSTTGPTATKGVPEASFTPQSWFVRDSQLITALQTTKKLSADEALRYRGKPAYDTLSRDGIISEDDLAATIADCLHLSWIPKARLKSVRISEDISSWFKIELMQTYNFLPFFKDDLKKQVSVIIDGATDFQRDPDISQKMREYHFNFYVGPRSAIQKIIQSRIIQKNTGSLDLSLFTETDEVFDESRLADKRLLLVEPQTHYQQALVSLFKGYENSLTIVSSLQEAMAKAKSEKFNHIWANRDVIGDELAFESALLKNNPSCDLRLYDNMGEELLEDSIHYLKFREFFVRMLQTFISQGSEEEKTLAQDFGSFATRVARAATQNHRELDEVYFSALLYKWERMRPQSKRLPDLLQGIFRFRHILDSIGERFDGRGPMALKGQQIPLASRVLACLSVADKILPQLKAWDEAPLQQLREAYHSTSGKQLDPTFTAQVLELLAPKWSQVESRQIYIVDSHTEFSNELKAHCQRLKIQATIFPDGASALATIKRSPPDLIVTEIAVPKLDGFSLAARLKTDSQLQHIPIVFLSDSKRPEHSTKAIQLGAEDFLSKDQDPQFLLAKIERIIQSKKKN